MGLDFNSKSQLNFELRLTIEFSKSFKNRGGSKKVKRFFNFLK